MIDEKMETISAKLRRWADEGEKRDNFASSLAVMYYGTGEPEDVCADTDAFRRIADDIEREKREITELYARKSWMNPAVVIAKLAKGEIEWAELQQAIERYYLPRPLFDDGEPAQFGDRFQAEVGKPATLSSLTYTKGHSDYFNVNGWERHDFAHRLKRPKPQVLDADGVPIVVGDKVWMLPGEHCETYPLKGYKAGIEYTVRENESASHKENGRICITGGDFGCGYPMPEQVTHREPDTQERIDDDATMPPRAYYAKRIGHDVGLKDDEEVWTAVTAHLLRRQRELDVRDA